MKGEIKYGNRNNEYRIANANAKNILVTNEDERGDQIFSNLAIEILLPW